MIRLYGPLGWCPIRVARDFLGSYFLATPRREDDVRRRCDHLVRCHEPIFCGTLLSQIERRPASCNSTSSETQRMPEIIGSSHSSKYTLRRGRCCAIVQMWSPVVVRSGPPNEQLAALVLQWLLGGGSWRGCQRCPFGCTPSTATPARINSAAISACRSENVRTRSGESDTRFEAARSRKSASSPSRPFLTFGRSRHKRCGLSR